MKTIHFKNVDVRLAESDLDVDAAQAHRYQMFYDEMGATDEMRVRGDGRAELATVHAA